MKKSFLILFLVLTMGYNQLFADDFVRFSTMDLLPWGYSDENENPTGIYSDIADEIAKEAGISYKNRIVPYRRMIADLETGKADVIMLFPNDLLKKSAITIVSLFALENVVIGLNGTQYLSLKELHGKTVAQIRGGNYDDDLTKDASIDKYLTKNYDQCIKMLFARRVDAIAGPSVSLFYIAEKLGFKREEFGQPLVLNSKEVFAYFAKKTANPQLIIKLKKTIEKLKNEKKIDKILKHYQQL